MSALPIKPTTVVEGISARSVKLLKGPLSYIDVFINAMPDLWSPTNRQGWVPLVVAENKLGNQLVLDRLSKVQEFPTWVMNYGGMKGSPQLQAVMASIMNETFVPTPTLNPENICILSGCSAILDCMYYCLGEDGQSVLIPAPYYPAFDNDLQARAHLVPTPFTLNEDEDVKTQLSAAADAAAAAGRPVASLLVSNPNNPLGTIYSQKTVRDALEWCLTHNVHYVSDEIYALSVYKQHQAAAASNSSAAPAPAADGNATTNNNHQRSFTSALTVAQELVDQGVFTQEHVDMYVHLVYGLSKDWCASGLRVGLLYSRNAPLHAALNSLAAFASISNHTQHVLAEALGDKTWRRDFILHNAKLLEKSYDVVTASLTKASVPFLPAVAGMFVWVDLRQWLPENTWEGEAALWKKVCDEGKVILTPGEACHAPEPGYFRLCFAWMAETDALNDAVDRIAKVLGIENGDVTAAE